MNLINGAEYCYKWFGAGSREKWALGASGDPPCWTGRWWSGRSKPGSSPSPASRSLGCATSGQRPESEPRSPEPWPPSTAAGECTYCNTSSSERISSSCSLEWSLRSPFDYPGSTSWSPSLSSHTPLGICPLPLAKPVKSPLSSNSTKETCSSLIALRISPSFHSL